MKKRKIEPNRPQPAPISDRPPGWIELHACWLFPFLLFLAVRMFSADAWYQLAGDQCTYLELGRTFPSHQLFDHELYLIHPPLFGYTIGFFRLFLPLFQAGLVTTTFFACLGFFAIRQIAEFENLPRTAIFCGLAYLALNGPAAAYDSQVLRVSILVCATAFALLAFLRLLREPSRRSLIMAILANGLCLAISEQALLLLPCEAVLVWIRGSRLEWKRYMALAAASGAVAIVWPVVRLLQFLRRPDLPAGIDGTIEFTKNFPLLALIQPNFLPFTNVHRSLFTQTSLSLGNLSLLRLFNAPLDLLILPRTASAILLVLLVAAAFVPAASRKRALVWLALTALFLVPVGVGMNEWYGMGFIIPFSLLVMEGAAVCFSRLGNPDRILIPALSFGCALLAGLWMAAQPGESAAFWSLQGGTHFLFARPPVTHGAEVSRFFAAMPRDTGIMAPQGLSPEIVYLTDKRVVAIPFDPRLLDTFLAKYRISYLVTSSDYRQQYNPPVANIFTSHLVTRYILEHPQKYRPVHVMRETYPAFYNPVEYYVLRVEAAEAKRAEGH